MKKYNQSSTWIVILIGLVIGLVALQIVFSLITSQAATTTITDDTFTASNSSCVDITDKCILSLTSVENATDGTSVGAGNYSQCLSNAGTSRYYDGILLDDAEYNGASLNATYVEVECGHISGLTSIVVNNIPVILAVALLMFLAGYVISKK